MVAKGRRNWWLWVGGGFVVVSLGAFALDRVVHPYSVAVYKAVPCRGDCRTHGPYNYDLVTEPVHFDWGDAIQAAHRASQITKGTVALVIYRKTSEVLYTYADGRGVDVKETLAALDTGKAVVA